MEIKAKPQRWMDHVFDFERLPPEVKLRVWLAAVGWSVGDLAEATNSDASDVRRVLRGDQKRKLARVRAEIRDVSGIEVPFVPVGAAEEKKAGA